jgi:hypothetical protein
MCKKQNDFEFRCAKRKTPNIGIFWKPDVSKLTKGSQMRETIHAISGHMTLPAVLLYVANLDMFLPVGIGGGGGGGGGDSVGHLEAVAQVAIALQVPSTKVKA